MYECERTAADNLVEAVKTVGTEKGMAFERAPSEDFLKAGKALDVGVLNE